MLGRHLSGPGPLPGDRRNGLRTYQGGDHRDAQRRQPVKAILDAYNPKDPPPTSTSPRRRRPAGKPIRASATSTGWSATATGRRNSAESPRRTPGCALTSRTRTSDLKFRISWAPARANIFPTSSSRWTMDGGSTESHRRDQGVSRRGRQGEGQHDALLLGPGVNNLGKFGRWAFAEFTAVYEIDREFSALLADFIGEAVV